MPKLDHSHCFISRPNRVLELLRLNQGSRVKDICSPACNEMGARIVFVRLIRNLLTSDN